MSIFLSVKFFKDFISIINNIETENRKMKLLLAMKIYNLFLHSTQFEFSKKKLDFPSTKIDRII